MATDVMRHNLPPKPCEELAEGLLARFPTVDHSELLKEITGFMFYQMRRGNKREERAACDYLNDLQTLCRPCHSKEHENK